MDLSSPLGRSVNDGISKELSSFHYTSVDEAAKKMVLLGKGALLAKMDIKQAYRNVPVAPEDRYLLGLTWDNKIYVDQVAVWPALCATHLLRSRRCPFMDDEAERHLVGNTLHRRLPNNGTPTLQRV